MADPAIPHRPGPVGRLVRLTLGVLSVQAAVGAVAELVDGVTGLPTTDDTGLIFAAVVAAWLTPTVFDLGLDTRLGSRWRFLVGGAIAAATLAGLALGAPGTGLSVGILVWVAVTLGWLGMAFLVAALLRTPGCEMRSPQHLLGLILPGDHHFVACPGPLQPLDEWEARTTGRAEPHLER